MRSRLLTALSFQTQYGDELLVAAVVEDEEDEEDEDEEEDEEDEEVTA